MKIIGSAFQVLMAGLVRESPFCRNAALSEGGEWLHVIAFNWRHLAGVSQGLLAALNIKSVE